MRIKFLLLSALALFATTAWAQPNAEMIQQAKAMGATDAQIQQAMASQQGGGGSKGSTIESNDNVELRAQSAENDIMSAEAQRAQNSADSLGGKLSKSKIFGQDIFSSKGLSFAPDLNIPTPVDYVLAAGDEVKINVWGNSELNVTKTISPEGRIFIDELGPISLSGLNIAQAENKVRAELSQIINGLEDGTNSISLSLGKIRSIKVNIVGEAKVPGTYTLPSIATLFNALYMAGGVNEIGSLRSIRVFRNNKQIADLDVYDYLMNGDSKDDIRLMEGDLIIVKPYESLVTTSGEVKRERIFELKSGETLEDLIELAGGFKGEAYGDKVTVKRKTGARYSIATVTPDKFSSFELNDTDEVVVRPTAPKYENRITVKGAVWYPGDYELGSDVNSVKELVEEAAGLKGDEFAGRAQIIREKADLTHELIAVDIRGIMNGSAADVELKPEDVLNIPKISELREEYTIEVGGAVNDAQTIDFVDGMTIEDAIISAGGLQEAAATIKVEVARRVKNPESTATPERLVEKFELDLTDGLQLSDGGSLILEPFDHVYVKFSPGYREQQVAKVRGEVLFRGDYALDNVSRLSDVVASAGGLSEFAYTKGASLTRQMSEDEIKRVNAIMAMSKRSEESRDSLAVDHTDIHEYSVGIDLERALANPGSVDDLVLRDGDVLMIPQLQTTVKISGAVVYPNSVTFTKHISAKKMLGQAGGYNDTARKFPIVVYMNGKVKITKRVAIFFKSYPKVEPGCEVIVPTKPKRDNSNLAEVLSIASSTTSMAAMVASMISILGN